MRNYYQDSYIRILYDPQTSLDGYDRYGIGPQSKTELVAYDDDHTDDDTIYVNTSTGSDVTGDGTAANPYATIATSILACDGDKDKVINTSSTGVYYEDLADITGDYCTGIYTSSGTVYMIQIDATTYAEYLALTSTGAYIYVNSDDGDDGTGDGSYETPYATIAKAKTEGDTAGADRYICITNSDTYTEPGIVFDGDCKGIWAYPGETPTLNFLVNNDLLVLNPSVKKAATTFENGAMSPSYSIAGAVNSQNQAILVYTDVDDGSKGKFRIYNSAGTNLTPATVFESGATLYASCSVFSDDTFCIAYQDNGDSGKGKFVIVDSTGSSILVGPKVFSSEQITYISTCVFANDTVLIVYSGNVSGGSYIIYDKTGSVVVAEKSMGVGALNYFNSCAVYSDDTALIAYSCSNLGIQSGHFMRIDNEGNVLVASTEYETGETWYSNISIFSDDTALIAYQDNGDSGKGKFVIVDKEGNIDVAPTVFEAGRTIFPRGAVLSYDIAIISFHDKGDGDNAKIIGIDSGGNIVFPAITFYAGDAGSMGPVLFFENETFMLPYGDDNDGRAGKFVIYFPPTFNMIVASTDTTIYGCYLTQNYDNLCDNLIHGDASTLHISYCDISSVVNGSGQDAWAISTDDEIAVNNSIIRNNDHGIYAATTTASITWNEIRGNSTVGINTDGAGVGIEITHNTIFSNGIGILLENNDGDEVVKNNVIHDNIGYAIEADTAIETTYSDITGTVSANVTKTSCITSNPLFVNEGTLDDDDDTDLHLMDALQGDVATSPAKNLADDADPDRNAGCYDTVYIGEGETWTSIVLVKPKEFVIKRIPVGATRNVALDGTIHSSVDGFYEQVVWKWEAMTNTELAGINAMFSCKNPRLLVYPDCITAPSDYDSYTLIYDDYRTSPKKNYKLSRTGVSDVSITVERQVD